MYLVAVSSFPDPVALKGFENLYESSFSVVRASGLGG